MAKKTMEPQKPVPFSILFAHPRPTTRRRIVNALRGRDQRFEIREAAHAFCVREWLEQERFDVLVLSEALPNDQELDLSLWIEGRRRFAAMKIIRLPASARGDEAYCTGIAADVYELISGLTGVAAEDG